MFFLGKFFFGDDGFQNTSVYQPTLNTLEIKGDKGIINILSWKSKGMYASNLKPLYTYCIPLHFILMLTSVDFN